MRPGNACRHCGAQVYARKGRGPLVTVYRVVGGADGTECTSPTGHQVSAAPTATGYRSSCACGWSKEYATKPGARGGLAAHKCRKIETQPKETK